MNERSDRSFLGHVLSSNSALMHHAAYQGLYAGFLSPNLQVQGLQDCSLGNWPVYPLLVDCSIVRNYFPMQPNLIQLGHFRDCCW